MATNIRRFIQGIQLLGVGTTAISLAGEVEYLTSTNKLRLHNGTSASPVVTEDHQATLTNKSLTDANVIFVGSLDATKVAKFDLSGSTTGKTTTIAFVNTNDRTITFPDITDTVVTLTATQTLTNKSMSGSANTFTNIPDGAFSTSYVKADGTRALTGNWAAGAFSITANSVVVGSAANTISGLAALVSSTANPASAGQLRLAAADTIKFRNAGNSADNSVGTASDRLQYNAINIPTISSTDTLSNKTFGDSPIFTQLATPASPSSGFNKIYPKSDNFFYSLDSTGTERKIGSGAGGINYITGQSTDFEGGIGSWIAYADAAGVAPVDGTGGSPTVTITSSATLPLVGAASGVITKTAVNSQGNGISCPFTIDSGYQAKVFSVSFVYKGSTNWVASTGLTGSESDLEVWVYDLTNNVLIPVNPYKLTTGAAQNGFYQGEFQTNSNSTSYRLILHVATTNALAWTVQVDNVIVQPQPVLYGYAGDDWVAYTPTFTGFGTPTNISFFSRRLGDSLQIMGKATSGTATGVEARITLGYAGGNANVTTDATKVASVRIVGNWALGTTSATSYKTVLVESAVNYLTFGINVTTTADLTKCSGSTFGNTADFAVFATVPIAGWSSNVICSQDTDTRIVAFSGENTAGTAIFADNKVPFATTKYDTHGGWSVDTYTIPISGKYKITANFNTAAVTFSTTQVIQLAFKLNSNEEFVQQVFGNGANHAFWVVGTKTYDCKAGDTLQVWLATGLATTLDVNGGRNYVVIERISGPATIASSETVAARGNTSSSPSAGTPATIVFSVKSYDTHGAFNTSTGQYTCPISGKYSVKSTCTFASTAWSAGAAESMCIYLNGSLYSEVDYKQVEAARTMPLVVRGSDEVRCLAGDVIDIRLGGSVVSLDGSSTNNFVAISRIGSY